MSKKVRRFMFNDIWNMGKIESWFGDMALKGFHIKSFEHFFAVFEKGEPLKTKYRVGVFYETPSMEQLEDYKKRGWDLAACRGDFYVFSSPEASSSPELYTDLAEQGRTLEGLNKKLKKNLLISSIGWVFIICITLSIFFIDKAPLLSIVEGDYFSNIFTIIVLILLLIFEIYTYAAFRAFRKSLIEGKPVSRRKDWRKGRIINGTALILIMAVALSVIVLPYVEIAKRGSYTLPESGCELPMIKLSEIEQNPNLKRIIAYDTHGIDWENKVSCRWSPLSPVQYEIREHGIVSGQLWKDGSGEYSPSIETHYYRLVFPKMASALVNALIDRHMYFRTPPKKIENTKFDALYTAGQNERKQIFAYTGDKVIYISYYGNKDMKSLIEMMNDMVF